MSQICKVTGKRYLKGNKISHSNIKTIRRFNVNLQWHKFWLAAEKRFVRLRVSAHGIRIIDKLGIEHALKTIKQWNKDISK